MESFEQITKKTYTTISSNWEQKRPRSWKPVREFLENIQNKKDKTILDLGCGTGRDCELAQNLGFENNNIIACDYSTGQLEVVKEKGFQTQYASMVELPFHNETFNVIISIAAFHHLLTQEDQLKSLKEIKRILKEEGEVLISIWNPTQEFITKNIEKNKFEFIDNEEDFKGTLKVTYDFENKKYDRYYYFFREDEIKSLFKKAKLELINKEYYEGNDYFLLK